ncbi:MAG: hypothetical protein ACKO5C_00765 [Ferruginibacter sp.]
MKEKKLLEVGVQELRKRTADLQTSELIQLLSRLMRFKRENKELVAYELFVRDQPEVWFSEIRESFNSELETMNTSHPYFMKKTMRKLIRRAKTYARYAGDPAIESELFCGLLEVFNEHHLHVHPSDIVRKIYYDTFTRLEKNISKLHEDLQYDFERRLADLSGRD